MIKMHRIPGTQSRVKTQVQDLLGQPSYELFVLQIHVFILIG